MKKFLKNALLVSFTVFCGQAFAAQDTDKPGQSYELKTGTYRICHGGMEDCRQGKGTLGDDYLDFEKNGTGRYTFKYKETGFLWRPEEDALILDVNDEGEHRVEVLENSRMLLDFRGRDTSPYVLIEDEDTVFKPGAYIQCDKSAVEKCGDLVNAYLESMENDDEGDGNAVLKNPHTVLILYTTTAEDWPSELCLKGSSDCTPLTWEQKNNRINVTMPGGDAKKKIFTIDHNKLIDAATEDVYLRIRNERVMRSAS